MPFDQVPALIEELRGREATSALALEFTILTAARTGETLGATWSEIELNKALWTIPGSRMKAGREHRVPLVERALEILRDCLAAKTGDFVSPAPNQTSPCRI